MEYQENFRYGMRRERFIFDNNLKYMVRYLACLLVGVILFSACGNKKKPSLSGNEPVTIGDFIESFELIKPPYEVSDTSLDRKDKDSLLIANKIFAQFVPDSVLTKLFGKSAKPKFYLGKRVEVDKQETYLFAKVVAAEKKACLVLCFDKKNKFKAYLPLLVNDANAATSQLSGLNKKYEFYKSVVIRKQDGSTREGKEVYIYNDDAGQFLLIMTDALDERVREIVNPIDTLPRKNKFSADYVKDKMNIVSIRDGSKSDKLNFFIHFERNNGECIGELKGVANFSSANTAVYKHAGDACGLQFNFTAYAVSIKEVEPCGAHRGVKCSFDGSFPRKKEIKKKTAAKSSSK